MQIDIIPGMQIPDPNCQILKLERERNRYSYKLQHNLQLWDKFRTDIRKLQVMQCGVVGIVAFQKKVYN